MRFKYFCFPIMVILAACETMPEPAPAPPPEVVVELPAPMPEPLPPEPAPLPPPPPPDPADIFVLPKLLAIPRNTMTDAVDGCVPVQKGLLNTEGFMVFTCEKLLPWYDIADHAAAFDDYKQSAIFNGWLVDATKPQTDMKTSLSKTDNLGCKRQLEISQWTDRSMNETYPKEDRNSHRQIIFIQRFYGPACEPYYDVVVDLSNGIG